MNRGRRRQPESDRAMRGPGERGLAMVVLVVTLTLVTMISLSLVGLMNTDMSHAAIQYAVARSFYIAEAGLAEAKAQMAAAADPSAYTTPARGVTAAYGGGRFTYWVDPDLTPTEGPCGAGIKTLEAVGEVPSLGRVFSSRVRSCGVAAPVLAALFGVSRVRVEGAGSRLLFPPYLVDAPGGGGNLGSFTEINFADEFVQLNAISEGAGAALTLRDGRFPDYMLFGFPIQPGYGAPAATDPAPWILSIFGDIIKAQPATGPAANPCGTPYACVTVGNGVTDVPGISDLRGARSLRHVYMNAMRRETVAAPALSRAAFRARAALNMANAPLNQRLGLAYPDAVYPVLDFYRIVAALAADPAASLRGPVYVEGSFSFERSVDLGDVTLSVAGDLVVRDHVAVAIRHDLTAVPGRRTPGILVLGAPGLAAQPFHACEGEDLTGSGRFVLCDASALAVDGLVYTQDGMAVHRQAMVDQVGAMYHDSRGTGSDSFLASDATVVVRFDPLALSAFDSGIAVLSWQQLK